MKCPNDNETLLISERHGVEIDYCPECRGVWLDRGELDKIIDQANDGQLANHPRTLQSEQPEATPYAPQDARDGRRYNAKDDYARKKRRKESFLGDLFDFGD